MVTIYGEHEQRVVDQLERCVAAEDGAIGVLMPDGHLGYSMPIGGVVGYRDHVSPSGVGYDIGCGNKAVRTPLQYGDIADELSSLMDQIYGRVSFGVGRNNERPVDHPVLDHIRTAAFEPQRDLADLAARQLGTVGAGNHYVDLFRDEDDDVWVGVHFGSRGFGHKTASGFLAMNQGLGFHEHATEGEMDSPPILFGVGDEIGDAYLEAMWLAGEYAYAGRDVVVDEVLDILGTVAVETVHNHHNYTWLEQHGGEDLWVVRKGATPAFAGQPGFVGATMGEDSVILQGTGGAENSLFSTVHGAGRAMSRTAAAGKSRRRKRYACMDRDCSNLFEIDGVSAHNAAPRTGICPDHSNARIKKVWIREQKSPGRIDWDAARADLRERGIELRGGAADEAPGAYKRLTEVLESAPGVAVRHVLTPIGVAMAGADTYDPFKD